MPAERTQTFGNNFVLLRCGLSARRKINHYRKRFEVVLVAEGRFFFVYTYTIRGCSNCIPIRRTGGMYVRRVQCTLTNWSSRFEFPQPPACRGFSVGWLVFSRYMPLFAWLISFARLHSRALFGVDLAARHTVHRSLGPLQPLKRKISSKATATAISKSKPKEKTNTQAHNINNTVLPPNMHFANKQCMHGKSVYITEASLSAGHLLLCSRKWKRTRTSTLS